VRINYDGYLNGVGRMLIEYVDTEEKVDELIRHGEIRNLDNNGDEYYAEYYQEKNGHYKYDVDASSTDFIRRVLKGSCEHFYVMDNGVWLYGNVYVNDEYTFTSLKDALEKEKVREADEDE